MQFGGIDGGTKPEWHIEHIKRVREVGGYPIYHHEMFQYGYDCPHHPAERDPGAGLERLPPPDLRVPAPDEDLGLSRR